MRYIIDFDDNLSSDEVEQYLINNSITKIKQFGTFGHVFLIESATEIAIDDKVMSVITDSEEGISLLSVDITLVDRGIPSTFELDDEKNWWKVASINNINFDKEIQDHMIRGVNSTVYLVDSGITVDHPEFATSNVVLLHSINDTFVDNKGHGTALASLIVGSNCGLSNPTLKVVKLFDTTQPTLQSDLINALDTILADYNSNGRKPSVVNMSWSIPKNEYINDKIQYMINQGLFVVASSGNSGMPIGDVTPASIPDVLTIGSYGQTLLPSAFSNYTSGSTISYTDSDVNYGALDGWGPGEMIYTATKEGTYSYIAGTSAACAIASAAFAYNLDIVLQDDGHLQSEQLAEKHRLVYYKNLSVAREGLLDLSDSRYAGSLNKIVTFTSVPKMNSHMYRIKTKAGAARTFYVFNPILVSQVSFDDLPAYMSVNDRGFVTINYPEISQLVERIDGIEFGVTHRDGSIEHGIINITAWHQDYVSLDDLLLNNPQQLESDPILEYELASGPGQCFEPGCAEDGCSFYSGGAVVCFGDKYGCLCS